MIPKDKIFKLIAIYSYICDLYDNEQKLKIKQIHNFANDYLLSWFPKIPCYVAFTLRMNRLSEVFKHIAGTLLSSNCPDECDLNTRPATIMQIQ